MRTVFLPAALCLLLLATSGCVTRELVITSDPAGATVRLNDTYEGVTPFTHRFTHYQTWKVVVEKEGYIPVSVEEHVTPPFMERPGPDLVNAVGPWHNHDRREFHYTLEKIEETDPVESVIQRAQAARDRIRTTAEEQAKKDEERRKQREGRDALPLPVKERARKAEEKREREEKAGTKEAAPAPESAPAPETPAAPAPPAE